MRINNLKFTNIQNTDFDFILPQRKQMRKKLKMCIQMYC